MSREPNELSPELARRLAEFLHGDLSPAERRRRAIEILESPELAEALYEDAALRATLEDVAGAGDARGNASAGRIVRRGLPPRLLLPLAAAVALALLAPWLLGDRDRTPGTDEEFRFRSGTGESRGDAEPDRPDSAAADTAAVDSSGDGDGRP